MGIAIFNHPSSFRYPTGWHVRTYGLFAANPFAERSFAGKDRRGRSYTLPQGKEIVLRYRVFLHRGDEKKARSPRPLPTMPGSNSSDGRPHLGAG